MDKAVKEALVVVALLALVGIIAGFVLPTLLYVSIK